MLPWRLGGSICVTFINVRFYVGLEHPLLLEDVSKIGANDIKSLIGVIKYAPVTEGRLWLIFNSFALFVHVLKCVPLAESMPLMLVADQHNKIEHAVDNTEPSSCSQSVREFISGFGIASSVHFCVFAASPGQRSIESVEGKQDYTNELFVEPFTPETSRR